MILRTLAVVVVAATSLTAAGQRSLLAVFSHPDDETVVGPLLAQYARSGHRVHLVTLTAGQKGVQPHANIPGGARLAAVRAKELACSVEKLGLAGHTLLEFEDQGFAVEWDAKPMNAAANRVREAIDRHRPDVILTWGPDGGTGHPDHRTASNVTTQAFQMRSLLRHHPSKLYYVVVPDKAVSGAQDWWKERRVSREFITTEIDAASGVEAARASLECHKSQYTAGQIEAMSRMDEVGKGRIYLRLALSSVGMPAAVEKDLFERVP